jgi:hypothetical protein
MSDRTPPPLARAGLIAAGIVVLQALLVAWFAWPSAHLEPRDLPVVVAGPAPAAAAVAQQLDAARPGAFEVTTAADAAAADDALRDREAYAAFVVGTSGLELRVASAASPTVAALLTQAAQQLGSGTPVQVTDVVASPADDPRGAGFASGLLPLVLTSLVAGALLAVFVRQRGARLAGVIGYPILAGLVGAALLRGLGVLHGEYLVEAGAVGLLALAISATVAGLGSVLGRPGIGLGALLIFVLANPISGVAAAPELLPKPWGAVGQLLPPGAGATLLRSVSFFDGAGATTPLLVLAGWAVVGLLLVALGRTRLAAQPDTAAQPDDVTPVEPVPAAS